jgi:hypothetical protein
VLVSEGAALVHRVLTTVATGGTVFLVFVVAEAIVTGGNPSFERAISSRLGINGYSQVVMGIVLF